jgi:Arc/MetJ-type ribon-helix-helix transcriptional regulator
MATLTITLPDDLAADIRALVATGEYADESAVIVDLLRDHAESPEMTAWLRRDVPKRLAAIDAGTAPLFNSSELRTQLAEWRDNDR